MPFQSAALSHPTVLPLKVFHADQAPASLTLREAFIAHVLPDLQEEQRTRKTFDEYANVLNHWETLTDDPYVAQIDRKVLRAFRKKLIETPYIKNKQKHKRSPATVNKIMRTLKAAISPLWPADRHNPGGAGLVEYFKPLEALPEQGELPFVFSRSEMSALYRHCDAAMQKKGNRRTPLYCAAAWRAAIVLALNAGPRTWDLFALRWEDIHWNEFKYGSVKFRATKTHKLQRIPLNKAARIHLLHLKSLNLHGDLVFPQFKKVPAFYKAWHRICAAAKVNAPFEAFRKTCSTLHDDVIGGVGEWICGHSLRGVNAKNYQNPTNRVFRAIYGLKCPVEFRRGARALLASQPIASA